MTSYSTAAYPDYPSVDELRSFTDEQMAEHYRRMAADPDSSFSSFIEQRRFTNLLRDYSNGAAMTPQLQTAAAKALTAIQEFHAAYGEWAAR